MSDHSTPIRPLAPVVTEVHASMCALLGALMLGAEAVTLARAQWPGPALAAPLAAAATLGCAAAVLPWLWPALPLAGRRGLIWTAWVTGGVTAMLALIFLGYGALLGAQLLLLAAVLPETSGEPRALRWFWISLLLMAAAVLTYLQNVDLRLTN